MSLFLGAVGLAIGLSTNRRLSNLERAQGQVLQRIPARGPAMILPMQPTFGFTAPTTIYEAMRAVKRDADRLGPLYVGYVTNPALLAAWAAWLADWQAFHEKYQGTFARLGAMFYSDELAERVRGYSTQLAGFFQAYEQQRRPDGTPVPPVTPGHVLQDPQGQDDAPKPGGVSQASTFPWWVWMLGGAAAVGLGYYLVKRISAPSSPERDVPRLPPAPAPKRDLEPFALERYADIRPPERMYPDPEEYKALAEQAARRTRRDEPRRRGRPNFDLFDEGPSSFGDDLELEDDAW